MMHVAKKFGDECMPQGGTDVKNCVHATKKLARHILEKIFTHHGIDARKAILSAKHLNLLKMRREGIANANRVESGAAVPSPVRNLLGIMYDEVPTHQKVGITLTDDQFKSVMKLMEEEWGKLAKKDFNQDGNLSPREFEAYLAESATTAEWLEMQTRPQRDLLIVEHPHKQAVSSNRMWIYGLGGYAILLTVLAGYLFCKLSKIANKLSMIYAMDNVQVTTSQEKQADEGKETTAISLQKTGKYDFATIS